MPTQNNPIDFPSSLLPQGSVLPSIRNVVREICARARAQKMPFLLQTLGVPGVGKSTLVAQLQNVFAAQAPSILGFDGIMEALPEYQTQAAQNKQAAFSAYELPARSGTYLAVRDLMAKKANIIFDHGGGFDDHFGMLDAAKKAGYVVVIAHVTAAPDVAKNRILYREITEGRHTPLIYVDERNVTIGNLLDRYRTTADTVIEIQNPKRSASERSAFLFDTAQQIHAQVETLRSRRSGQLEL